MFASEVFVAMLFAKVIAVEVIRGISRSHSKTCMSMSRALIECLNFPGSATFIDLIELYVYFCKSLVLFIKAQKSQQLDTKSVIIFIFRA